MYYLAVNNKYPQGIPVYAFLRAAVEDPYRASPLFSSMEVLEVWMAEFFDPNAEADCLSQEEIEFLTKPQAPSPAYWQVLDKKTLNHLIECDSCSAELQLASSHELARTG